MVLEKRRATALDRRTFCAPASLPGWPIPRRGRNHSLAGEWLRRAADAGRVDARFNLAVLLSHTDACGALNEFRDVALVSSPLVRAAKATTKYGPARFTVGPPKAVFAYQNTN